MRISESQLRKVVRAIIREQIETVPPAPATADSWISTEDVADVIENRLMDSMLDYVSDHLSDSDTFYMPPDASRFIEKLAEFLPEQPSIEKKFFAMNPNATNDDYVGAVDQWMNENSEEITRIIQDELQNIIDNADMHSGGNETDEIFGSEAGYWRYRNG